MAQIIHKRYVCYCIENIKRGEELLVDYCMTDDNERRTNKSTSGNQKANKNEKDNKKSNSEGEESW